MSNLVVMAFEEQHKAFELRAELLKLQRISTQNGRCGGGFGGGMGGGGFRTGGGF